MNFGVNELIKLNMPVIVEGKYDKITLENVVDALIIPTNGFGIFKDKEKRALIRSLARQNGLIVMTDSDKAGSVIRAHLKNIVGDARIIPVYVPQLKGVEKRKTKPSKEGFLGVEGMSKDCIEQALRQSGVLDFADGEERPRITKNDLYLLGLSGRENSAGARRAFLSFLGLPPDLSSAAMLDVLRYMMSPEELKARVAEWQTNTAKS